GSILARALHPVAARRLLSVRPRATDVYRPWHGNAGDPGSGDGLPPAAPIRHSRRRGPAPADRTAFAPPGRRHAGAGEQARRGPRLWFTGGAAVTERPTTSYPGLRGP